MTASISYPEINERLAAARRVIECLAQATPVTAALAHLYGYTHPAQFEQDLERFHREVAATVNDHGERLERLERLLKPRTVLSELALEVAFHLLRGNATGRESPVDYAALQAAFAGSETKLLEEAAAELVLQRYATALGALGHPIVQVRPTRELFLAFDLAATGRDTRADALEVARTWLEVDETANVFRLSERLRWEPRRLNPALLALRPVFPNGRWSREIDATFETTSVLILPEERFKLRRIASAGRVD